MRSLCQRSYDRYAHNDATIWGAMAWAIKRTRLFERKRTRLAERMDRVGLLKKRAPTRRDLLLVVGELQDLIGALGSAYQDDRNPERSDAVQRRVAHGLNLCVAALCADPPQTGRWRP